jgi:hypothetical protein
MTRMTRGRIGADSFLDEETPYLLFLAFTQQKKPQRIAVDKAVAGGIRERRLSEHPTRQRSVHHAPNDSHRLRPMRHACHIDPAGG